MELKDLKVVEIFKEKLRHRIMIVWWIICIFLLLAVGVYAFFNRGDLMKNIKIFGILVSVVIAIMASLTSVFYFTRKKKFYELLSTLKVPEIEEVEKAYREASKYNRRKPVIFTKDGITIIKNFFMFENISADDIVWLYQYESKEMQDRSSDETIPAISVVTRQMEIFPLLGYKLSSFIRQMYKNVYYSIEGTYAHRVYQNDFSLNFVKMVEAIGKSKNLPSKYDDSEEGRKNVDIANIISKKQKRRKIRAGIRMFFVVMLQIGFFLGCLALILWIVSKYPTVGKKVLIANTILTGLFVLFILACLYSFVRKFMKRSMLGNLGMFVFIGMMVLGFKVSNLYTSVEDLFEKPEQGYYSIGIIDYRKAFWVPKDSEYLMYIYPAEASNGRGRNKDTRAKYTFKKSDLENHEEMDKLIADLETINTYEWPYLKLTYYPKSKTVSEIEIVDRSEYREFEKKGKGNS